MLLGDIEIRVVQVVKRPFAVVAFWDDGNSTLSSPAEKDLRRICFRNHWSVEVMNKVVSAHLCRALMRWR
jgi:hypothetical protein